ncbi:U6 snRNP-associated protein Lsm7 [Sporothrix curviconia]|uniref:U6 snRNP-associated protein Lsm7 n=1 Tax=Sporothrix curviconia TaxID=1260050 RepID=A0ABP0BYN4_9PEZI
MSTPFRGRYSPASRGGGGNNSGGSGRGGNNSGEYRGSRGGTGGGGRGGGQYPRGGGRGDRGGYQRGGGRGGAGGESGGRGGGGFARGGGHGGPGGDREAPKKESILDLGQYMDREIYVKFNGGREVSGILKGFDPLLNMVLDDAQEKMRNAEGEVKSRSLGLAVIRGTHITTLHPVEGSESIANPYLAAAEAAEGEESAEAGQPAKVTPAYQYTPKAEEEESD